VPDSANSLENLPLLSLARAKSFFPGLVVTLSSPQQETLGFFACCLAPIGQSPQETSRLLPPSFFLATNAQTIDTRQRLAALRLSLPQVSRQRFPQPPIHSSTESSHAEPLPAVKSF
jgi:hypothetical protein